MSQVFLSYAREDQAMAERMVQALAREGLDAWWDHEIPPGRSWDEVIGGRIAGASVIVALWSTRSITSNFVKEEAQLAYDAGKLLPVRIDDVEPPMGFRRMQAANLVGWQGEADHRQWRVLVDEIRARLAGGTGPLPPPSQPLPPPPPASSTPRPAHTPPPSSLEAPASKGLGPLAITGIVLGGIVAAVLLAFALMPRNPAVEEAAAPPSLAATIWTGYVNINPTAGCNSFNAGMMYHADGTAQFSFNGGAWEENRYNWSQIGSDVTMTIPRGETWQLIVNGSTMTGTYNDGTCTGTLTLTQSSEPYVGPVAAPVDPAPAPVVTSPQPAPQPTIPSVAGTTWAGYVTINPSSGCNSFNAGFIYYSDGTAQFSFNGGAWEDARYNWSQNGSTVIMTIPRGETWRLTMNGSSMFGTYDDGTCTGSMTLNRQ
jgi:hypothetical protein